MWHFLTQLQFQLKTKIKRDRDSWRDVAGLCSEIQTFLLVFPAPHSSIRFGRQTNFAPLILDNTKEKYDILGPFFFFQ